MDDSPTGNVTFLATDIQGSTEMWERFPREMPAALERHEQLLREAVEARGGSIFKNVGDGLFTVFPVAPPAVEAALEGQLALIGEHWATPAPVRVRMALHSGQAEERAGDYFGPPVNRVARILSAGHGGQILLSQAVERLVSHHFPEGAALRDLGERSLKDLTQPERLFQLVSNGLPVDFPPLNTLDARPHNLPAQPTPIVGRTREVDEVVRLILRRDVRLVTLLGPSGAGKSRLGLQVAAELVDAFRNGVFHVEMAVVHEPGQVAQAILNALGIQPEGRAPGEALREHLRPLELLLVLDNFEQVLEAAPLVADLLRVAPALEVLVTSQAPLRLRGEHEYMVSPLAIPGVRRPRSIERLADYDAVQLFTERARAVVPSFRLEPANADAVAEIVRQLDGLPLAIELAAARLKLFPPQAMVGRLARRFDFLKGGRRDLPDRQRTLRRALEWSYNLLDEHEQALFRRLSVFDGGFTLEAAERVCGAEDEDFDIVDAVSSLVDKSLLRPVAGDGSEPRFERLRTIRDFSLDLLEESGEADRWRRRHAEFFAELADGGRGVTLGESPDPNSQSQRDPQGWLDRIDSEHENIRAALTWALDRDEAGLALRLCLGLPALWLRRGLLNEARRLVDRLLSLTFEDDVQRAHAINISGRVAQIQGENTPEVIAKFEEALALYRAADHKPGIARALMNLGNVRARQGAFEAARELFREALPLYREIGNVFGECGALMNLGDSYLGEDDFDRAEEMFTQARDTASAPHSSFEGMRWEMSPPAREDARRKEAPIALAFALQYLGLVAQLRGDLDRAETRYRDGRTLFETFGARPNIAWSEYYLGLVARDRGDLAAARSMLLEALEQFRDLDYRLGIAAAVLGMATLEAREGRGERAARLLGVSRILSRGITVTREKLEDKARQEVERAGRAALGDAGFDRAVEAGKALSLDEALQLAQDAADPEPAEAAEAR